MSNSVLHVMNGDASTHLFHQSGLLGDCMVWREMLCEGPTHTEIDSEKFWKGRLGFFQNFCQINEKEYRAKTEQEINRFKGKSYDEVVFWFEYDLFCQVNLLAAITYLHKEQSQAKFHLVCTGDEIEKGLYKGLGEFCPQDYPQLLKTRIALNESSLHFARSVWEAYCSEDHSQLYEQVLLETPREFKYLQLAFEWHKKRFLSDQTGLNFIEERILKKMSQSPHDSKSLVASILKERLCWGFGFGDLQYFVYLENLQNFYKASEEGVLLINKRGLEVLSGKNKCRIEERSNYKYGNCYSNSYTYFVKENKLVKA